MTSNTTEKEHAAPDQGADRTPVTVIGLGLMGQALAGAFLDAGHPTTIWNRTAAKGEGLVARGAQFADSVGDAVAASPLVVVCLTDYEGVRGLLEPLGDVLGGRVLVNLTSGTPREARETAEWAGAGYLDGAILAVPEGIGKDALVLYSGPRSAFEAHESALSSLGAGVTYLGDDHGLASLYDVSMLSLMWNILNGFLQSAALLGAAGVDASAFVPIATKGIETVTDWLPDYARQVDDGVYPAYDSTIDTHAAAMRHLVAESEALGVNAELPRLIQDLAGRAVAAGRGGDGYAALIEQFRKPARA
ncbi:NAD(P)-dependent oxidoreductase [Actinomadura sp. NEAU-AAG7]|uniref:NAD(P)-dependent oxidoreductase n=1 Tax=Actinomadura sp. NEAU-AAG7 TaxID=2839640 RepID=UPI001BE417CF|nr:NAD(P)-binding domain-containing protein [Actinomadura sp. NEAU-AAG7]MBT2210215.1 NAD(P)-binding domain-containing protein [Actinomadura sp. NEAU-AAG7]